MPSKRPMWRIAGVAGPCGAFWLRWRKKGLVAGLLWMKSTARWVITSPE